VWNGRRQIATSSGGGDNSKALAMCPLAEANYGMELRSDGERGIEKGRHKSSLENFHD
jgi:hypothetical protein